MFVSTRVQVARVLGYSLVEIDNIA